MNMEGSSILRPKGATSAELALSFAAPINPFTWD